jgi:hypothetical protein
MTSKRTKPKLSIVSSSTPPSSPEDPPRLLGDPGLALWRSIVAEYDVSDAAGREILCQACAALDRAEACREIIDRAGELVETDKGPRENPLCKVELGNRAFVVRTLAKLGLDLEPIGRVGRPARFPGSR